MQPIPRLAQVQRRPVEPLAAGELFPDVRRILVWRADPFSDLVLTLPALAALRAAYPAAWIGLLLRPSLTPLGRLIPGVDERVEQAADRDVTAERVRAFHPDLLVAITPGSQVPWAALRARVPHRVGRGRRAYSALFERTVDEPSAVTDRHEAERALAFAQRCGSPAGPALFQLSLPPQADEAAEAWLGSHQVGSPFVVLHPGHGGESPSWPVERFLRLARLLLAEGVAVVLSVGPSDGEVAAALDAAEPALRKLPRFHGDLPTLAACLRRAGAVAANPIGPLHLSAALGTPTVSFHPPWPARGVQRRGPYAPNGWGIAAELEGAASWSVKQQRRLGDDLLAGISPALALSTLLALLEGRAPAG